MDIVVLSTCIPKRNVFLLSVCIWSWSSTLFRLVNALNNEPMCVWEGCIRARRWSLHRLSQAQITTTNLNFFRIFSFTIASLCTIIATVINIAASDPKRPFYRTLKFIDAIFKEIQERKHRGVLLLEGNKMIISRKLKTTKRQEKRRYGEVNWRENITSFVRNEKMTGRKRSQETNEKKKMKVEVANVLWCSE